MGKREQAVQVTERGSICSIESVEKLASTYGLFPASVLQCFIAFSEEHLDKPRLKNLGLISLFSDRYLRLIRYRIQAT